MDALRSELYLKIIVLKDEIHKNRQAELDNGQAAAIMSNQLKTLAEQVNKMPHMREFNNDITITTSSAHKLATQLLDKDLQRKKWTSYFEAEDNLEHIDNIRNNIKTYVDIII